MKKWALMAPLGAALLAMPAHAFIGQKISPDEINGGRESGVSIGFCGTYIKEWQFCGDDPPDIYKLEKETITTAAGDSPLMGRIPYIFFKDYGNVAAVFGTAPHSRTFWFIDG